MLILLLALAGVVVEVMQVLMAVVLVTIVVIGAGIDALLVRHLAHEVLLLPAIVVQDNGPVIADSHLQAIVQVGSICWLYQAQIAVIANHPPSAYVGEAALDLEVITPKPVIIGPQKAPQILDHSFEVLRSGDIRQIEVLSQAIVLRSKPVDLKMTFLDIVSIYVHGLW